MLYKRNNIQNDTNYCYGTARNLSKLIIVVMWAYKLVGKTNVYIMRHFYCLLGLRKIINYEEWRGYGRRFIMEFVVGLERDLNLENR